MDIEWADPPRTRADAFRDEVAQIAQQLYANPGKWARLKTATTYSELYHHLLESAGLEWRSDYEPYGGGRQSYFNRAEQFDLYARAPQETP